MTATLIFTGVNIDSEFKREEFQLWEALTRKLDPKAGVVVFDTASPLEFKTGYEVVRFDDNPGHLSHGGGDGWGRTFTAGIQFAIDEGYDYVCYRERDCFVARPVREVTERMRRTNVKAAHFFLPHYQFPENAFAVYNVDFMWDIKFVEKYDWRNRKPIPMGDTPAVLWRHTPECIIQDILGDDLWLLPWWGSRNDRFAVNYANLHEYCPYEPPTWLHMAQDMRLYHRFLELNGITLP